MGKNIRQLAAIMFTDMVGFTAMMQSDENTARDRRDKHRKVLETNIGNHQGQILQYYGDGTLVIFNSAVEAVLCAVEIQKELQREPKIPLRIGIHIGDIVHDDEGIYGDAVNIASRIESLSVTGGVLISDRLCDELKNHPEIKVTLLGNFDLKNVKRPVGIFAINHEHLEVPSIKDLDIHQKNSKKTIAVLPFVNMSADPENEYFGDGITEEIINALTRVDGLDVTARTSAFAFKNQNMDIRDIGKQLGVINVLEGSVRKSGSRVRITAQLINTADGFHIFSEVYDRDIIDIFAVQDEIAKIITNKLRENLEAKYLKDDAEKPPTENLEAYDLYLRGKYELNKGSADAALVAEDLFKKVIQMEPGFAHAYTALSNVYSILAAFRIKHQTKTYDLAEEYAIKAIELDNTSVGSHLALAQVAFMHQLDFLKTGKLIHKAIELNPGSAMAHSWNAILLAATEKLDQALIEARLTRSLDPLSPMSNYVLGAVLYCMERFNEAIEQFDIVLSRMPFLLQAQILKGKSLVALGKNDNAIELFTNIPGRPEHNSVYEGIIAYAHAQKGDIDKSNKLLEKIKQRETAGGDAFINWIYTLLYLALDEKQKMYKYLEKCLEEKMAMMIFLRRDPMFKKYRNEPKFQNLLKTYLDISEEPH